MNKKSIMIDMDEVIVVGNFSNYLIEFLGEVDFEKLHSQYRQDLIKGREEEFRKIYKYQNLYKNNNKDYVKPLPNCVEVIKELNEKYEVFIVTTYIWKEDVIDAATNPIYNASKTGASAFRKAIQNDLAQNNIKITDVCPGLIKTDFYKRANNELPENIMNTGLTPEDVANTVKFVFDLPHEITIPSIEVRNIKNY